MDPTKTDDPTPMKRATKKVPAFKDSDVQRLIKAVKKTGHNPTAVEADVKAGRIRVIIGKVDDMGSDLDKWLEGHRESPPQRN